MLYISDYEEEWERDKTDIENKQLYAYVWNESDEVLSEIGLVGMEKIKVGDCNLLQRTF